LAELVARIVGYSGRVVFDHSHPDGTPRKLLDVSRLTTLGWRRQIALEQGIASTYDWFRKNWADKDQRSRRIGHPDS